MRTRLLVVSVAVAVLGSVSTAASGAPNVARAETVCTNGESREVVTFTPGLSETPTVGSWFSSGDVGTNGASQTKQ